MPQPAAETATAPSQPEAPGGSSGDSLSLVPLFKEFSPRFLYWEAPPALPAPFPMSAKKVLDEPALPHWCRLPAEAPGPGEDAAS